MNFPVLMSPVETFAGCRGHTAYGEVTILNVTTRSTHVALCDVCAVRREEDREAKDFSRLKSG